MRGRVGIPTHVRQGVYGSALYNPSVMNSIISTNRFSASELAQYRLTVLSFHARYGTQATRDAYTVSKATIYRWKRGGCPKRKGSSSPSFRIQGPPNGSGSWRRIPRLSPSLRSCGKTTIASGKRRSSRCWMRSAGKRGSRRFPHPPSATSSSDTACSLPHSGGSTITREAVLPERRGSSKPKSSIPLDRKALATWRSTPSPGWSTASASTSSMPSTSS